MNVEIDIDDDAYDLASAYALAQGLSIEAASSELLRQREKIPTSSGMFAPPETA